jgi:hypothetical protein
MALTAVFDPDRNLVQLATDGTDDGWDTATSATITRTVAGASPVPVRGIEAAALVGGVLVSSDNEAPMDAAVTYVATAVGPDSPVTLTAVVSTAGAEWGLWLKAPGRADLNLLAGSADTGDRARSNIGGVYDIPGGQRVAQFAGFAGLTTSLVVTTETAAQSAALLALLTQAPGGVLLIQSGQPSSDLPSDYYAVTGFSHSNPGGMRSDRLGLRQHTLQIAASAMPPGDSTGFAGATYDVVAATFATYQDLADQVPTYLDLAMGSW